MSQSKDEKIHYADYLQLSKLLNSQKPLTSSAKDEMLFIITHQTYELWFKQMHYELDRILEIFSVSQIAESQLGVVHSLLQRMIEIQKVLTQQFTILETMTPLDFLEFRTPLAGASGFQSTQFRALEIKLGLKMFSRTKQDQIFFLSHLKSEEQEYLLELESKPGLIQKVNEWLARCPFIQYKNFDFIQAYSRVVEKMFQKQRSEIQNYPQLLENERKKQLDGLDQMMEQFKLLNRQENLSMLAALFIQLYRDEAILHIPFKILNDLMDLDELISTWRYRHTLLAQRMLGYKPGTGGSTGHNYLMSTTLSNRLFPDLFQLSTYLIPRSLRPEIPRELKDLLNLHYSFVENRS